MHLHLLSHASMHCLFCSKSHFWICFVLWRVSSHCLHCHAQMSLVNKYLVPYHLHCCHVPPHYCRYPIRFDPCKSNFLIFHCDSKPFYFPFPFVDMCFWVFFPLLQQSLDASNELEFQFLDIKYPSISLHQWPQLSTPIISSGCKLQVLYHLYFLASFVVGPRCELQCLYHLLVSIVVCFNVEPLTGFHNHLDHPNLALFFCFVRVCIQGKLFKPFVKFKVQVFFKIIFYYILFLSKVKIYVTSLSFVSFYMRGSVRTMISYIRKLS